MLMPATAHSPQPTAHIFRPDSLRDHSVRGEVIHLVIRTPYQASALGKAYKFRWIRRFTTPKGVYYSLLPPGKGTGMGEKP